MTLALKIVKMPIINHYGPKNAKKCTKPIKNWRLVHLLAYFWPRNLFHSNSDATY